MKELRMNLQNSWRRVLAMVTVAAMCFSVVSISPAFAVEEEGSETDNHVTFSKAEAAEGETATSKVKVSAEGVDSGSPATVKVEGTLQLLGEVAIALEDDSAEVEEENYDVAWTIEDLANEPEEGTKASEAAATIDENGLVTGVAEGNVKAILTVTEKTQTASEDATAEPLVGELEIEVTAKEEPPVEEPVKKDGVTLEKAEAENETSVAINGEETVTLAAGGTLELTALAKIKTDDVSIDEQKATVKWSSSDEDVLKEDAKKAGTFEAVTDGEATVKVNVKYGEDDTEGTDSTNAITVKVETPSVPGDDDEKTVTTVEAVKIRKAATELTVGGTEKLEAEVTVSPADAAEPVTTWNSSNDKVAKVAADGTVTAIAAGTANITATAKIGESEKTSAPCVVTVKAKTVPSTDKPTEGNKPQNTTSNSAPKAGEKKVIAGVTYKVAKTNTVTYQKPKKNAKKVTIPATVKINGKTYKVTAVEKNAFKGNKKVKTVKVGKNVTTIGASAFQNCKALTTVTLPAKTTTIGKNAFANSKKLKKIVIKSTKMTKKTVKNSAFKGVSKKATVDVPNKKAKTYKKLFQKKGLPKACKVK